jgi:hypothetical protein
MSVWLAGASTLLAIAAAITCMRRKIQPKAEKLRDVDLPLHKNELSLVFYDAFISLQDHS